MSADDENRIRVSKLEVARNGRKVVFGNEIANVPARNGTYQTYDGQPITVVLDRVKASLRREKVVGIQIGGGDNPLRIVSIGRRTATGRVLDREGKTAIEIAVTPSLVRPERRTPLGQKPQRAQ